MDKLGNIAIALLIAGILCWAGAVISKPRSDDK